MNLPELAEDAVRRLGEKLAIDFEGEQFTNTQILNWDKRLQRGFARLGVNKGDGILLCLMNHILAFPIFQGIFRNGGIAIPVMFQSLENQIKFVLSDSGAKGIVTDEACLPRIREAAQGLDHVRWILVRGGEDKPDASPPEYRLDAFLDEEPAEIITGIDGDDVALMLYTSGTTGKSKGVMLTHTNLIATSEATNDAGELDKWVGPRIQMSAMPMAHICGIGVMVGGYLAPPTEELSYSVQMKWFEPERFMQLIEQHRCTSAAVVPTMLALMLQHPNLDKYDLSSLKQVVSGAATLPVEFAREFSERYDCRIREIYGMTESCGIATANLASEPYRPGCAGRAYFNTKVGIVDPDDNFLPPGERGEIVIKGPTVMKGYYNLPKETEEVMRGGWLHSGDVGYLDEDGYLYVVDRLKDMIIRGGENIYAVELEDILYLIPEISEAAIVGAPDPVYGEKVLAFVIARQGAELTEKQVIDFMKSRISKFKAPERVFFTDEIPKNPVGKVLKRQLREMAVKLM
jgi:long-chain acyl-CoA synthetase